MFVVLKRDVCVVVNVTVVGMISVSERVAALLQAELKLLSGYTFDSAGIFTASLLVTTATEVGPSVEIVVYLVMCEYNSLCQDTRICRRADFCCDDCLNCGFRIDLSCRDCCRRNCIVEVDGAETLVSLGSNRIIRVNHTGRGRS